MSLFMHISIYTCTFIYMEMYMHQGYVNTYELDMDPNLILHHCVNSDSIYDTHKYICIYIYIYILYM
jgi:hypothetical protein